MSTLVIYDDNGTIFFQASGDVQTPVGIPYMMVNVPQGKFIQRIDTAADPHQPVFMDMPKSEIEQEVETLKLMVADLGLMVGGGL